MNVIIYEVREIWKADILNIRDLSKQIIFDHFLREVKAIRTAGSNADWQLSLPY